MASPDLRTAVRTGAAHLDRMAARLAAMERGGRVTEPAYAELQHQYEVLGGYTLDQRVDTALSGPRVRARRVGQAAVGAVGRRADAGVAGSAGHRRPGPAAARRADEPPRPRRARMARGAPPAAGRLAARRVARPGVPRRDRDPRLGAARPAADGVPRRLQRVPPPARRARRAGGQGRRDAGRARSRARGSSSSATGAIASSARCTSTRRGSSGSKSERREAPKAGRKLAIPAAGAGRGRAVAQRRDRRPARGPGGRLPAGPRRDGAGRYAGHEPHGRRARAVPRRAARRADRHRRAERRRQDDAAADDRRRPAAARRRDHVRATPSSSATSPSCAARRSPGATVLDALLEAIPVTAGEARAYLARFLFRGDDAFKEVRSLSGGERSRLELALLGILPSNLLLLDEPTNHLDIPAREAIEAFMARSPATLLVVSHDRRLLETVCEKLWVVDDGSAVAFDGGYRAWRAAVAERLDAWQAALEAEAARLRGGPPAGRSRRHPAPYGAAPNGSGRSRARRPAGDAGSRHHRRTRRVRKKDRSSRRRRIGGRRWRLRRS